MKNSKVRSSVRTAGGMFLRGVTGLLVAVAMSVSVARAGVRKLERDPRVDLEELARTQDISVRAGREGLHYQADASAVLRKLDAARLRKVAMSFGDFKQMGMPNINDSAFVEKSSASRFVVWTDMSMAGQTSRHFLEVTEFSTGLAWEQVSRQPHWRQEEDSKFKELDGSWYMEPLPGGDIYVRYFLAARLDTSVPDFLVERVLKTQLPASMRKGIRVLEKQARE